MSEFESLWKAAVRYRRATRELQQQLSGVHGDLDRRDLPALRVSLERLLTYLASEPGRTDANCSTVDAFFNAVEPLWRDLPEEWRGVFDDMSGTLHDAIYAPDIARTFEATPEQLLQRVRKIVT